MKKFLWIIMGALFFPTVTISISSAATATATIVATSTNSQVNGTVLLKDTPTGLEVTATIQNAKPGEHGFHIHEFGRCTDLGKDAGGHYNPKNTPHGNIMKDGDMKAHGGDMGNILIKTDGTGTLSVKIPNLTLTNSASTAGGRAIVFHDKMDDFGQPVGNAGGRSGCGVITITGN